MLPLHPTDRPARDAALGGERMRLPWRHYWPAAGLAVAGLIATGVAGWQMDRWAQAKDVELFAAEARLIVSMIEQKAERYESMLGRLSDAFARENGEVSSTNWTGRLVHTLNTSAHYPNAVCFVIAPRILKADRAAFEQRATARGAKYPGRIITTRTNANYWLPVWQRSAKAGSDVPALGDDLLDVTSLHPSFEGALGATAGWVAGRPNRLHLEPSGAQTGFWFALPLKPAELPEYIRWQTARESDDLAGRRRAAQRANQTIGLLAAFIGGDLFLNEFNSPNAKAQVQLFTSPAPAPETLLNPGHLPPATPRHTVDAVMPWYGRRWLARLSSTPVFEAGSLQYRAWLTRGVGTLLTLGAAAVVAWQIRGRGREAALAAQLREALARQERLSRDLHDGTLQSVYGVGLALQRAQRLVEKRPAEATSQIGETMVALQGVIRELREFIRTTDAGAREEVRLGEALAAVVAQMRLGTEMEFHLELQPGADHGVTAAQSLQLLNFAREALSNAVRHSQARCVRVRLESADVVVRLAIEDDGRGFDPDQAQREGRGLANLAARVRDLGGSHRWDTSPGKGARLLVEIPASPQQTASTA